MIRKHDFQKLNFQVQLELKNAIEKAKNESKNNDFYLFLGNAQYIESLKETGDIPYVIDYHPDKRHDSFRLNVLMEYLNANYSFNSENTVDSFLSVTFELMIYSHMWESKPFLKQFFRFAQLTNGLDYSWDVDVPDMTKYEFIKEIREMFEKVNLKIADIITSSYNSSLRNAFAHSEYNFGHGTPEIFLTNYKGKASYEIKNLTFDEWTERFCKSFLIGYHFQNLIYAERVKLEDNKEYNVILRDRDGAKKNGLLLYDRQKDSFRAKIK